MDAHTGPIRWGVAATGHIANSFTEAFANVDDDASIVAVGSRAQETADTFGDAHGIERRHGTYADLAADPEVDVVYIASHHSFHREHARLFLEAGKHVLCEKPLALSAAQVDDMIAAARSSDRFLMEAMWMRFQPALVEVKRRIDEGAIGEIRRVLADFSFSLPTDSHRLLDPQLGGGALLDLGVYPFGLAWWLLGEPDTIISSGRIGPSGVDEEVNLFSTWPNGVTAIATCAVKLQGTKTARIEGTLGAIDLPVAFHAAGSATLTGPGGTETITGEPASLHHQTLEVHRCIRAGENQSPIMSWDESRAILNRLDEVRANIGMVYPGDI